LYYTLMTGLLTVRYMLCFAMVVHFVIVDFN
jgi:hypothetical protein